MKCPIQAHVMNNWSPADDAVLGGSENFRRWCLVGGSKSLSLEPRRLYLVPNPFASLPTLCELLYSLSAIVD
jgi:hypothetical protein